MPNYVIEVPEVYLRRVRVRADDAQDALRQAVMGNSVGAEEDLPLLYSRTLPVSEWGVKLEEEARLLDDCLLSLMGLLGLVEEQGLLGDDRAARAQRALDGVLGYAQSLLVNTEADGHA